MLLSDKLVYAVFIFFVFFIVGCSTPVVKFKNCPSEINYVTRSYDTSLFQSLKSAFTKKGISLKLNDKSILTSLKVSKKHQVIKAAKMGRLVSKFNFSFLGMTSVKEISSLELAYFHTFNVYHLERLKYVSYGLKQIQRNHELKAAQDISSTYIKLCNL